MVPQNAWSENEKLILEGLREALRSGGSSGSAVYQKLFTAQKLIMQGTWENTEELVKKAVMLAEEEYQAAKQVGAPLLPHPVRISSRLSDLRILKAD